MTTLREKRQGAMGRFPHNGSMAWEDVMRKADKVATSQCVCSYWAWSPDMGDWSSLKDHHPRCPKRKEQQPSSMMRGTAWLVLGVMLVVGAWLIVTVGAPVWEWLVWRVGG